MTELPYGRQPMICGESARDRWISRRPDVTAYSRVGSGLRRSLAVWLLLLCAPVLRAEETDRPLVIGTKHSPPFSIRNDDGTWSGISIDLWRLVAADLGLRFELREMELGDLLEGLESGELDVAAAAITVTADREARVDFSHPYHHAGLGIVVTRDSGSSLIGWLSGVFTRRFFEAVAALVTVLMAAGAAVWLFERRRNPEQFGGSPAKGLGSAFWWSAVTMTTVGYGDKAPRTPGGRIVALVWMFAAVIITSGLTAAIASSLTVSRLESRFEDLKDLRKEPIAAIRSSTSASYLANRGFRVAAFDSLELALDAVLDGTTAAMVHDEPIVLHHILSRPQRYGKLDVLPVTFEPQDYAFALPPESPLRQAVSIAVLERTHEDRWHETLRHYLGDR